jgi:hypothetical protein
MSSALPANRTRDHPRSARAALHSAGVIISAFLGLTPVVRYHLADLGRKITKSAASEIMTKKCFIG